MMQSNQNNIDDTKKALLDLKPLKKNEIFENVNYLYPNIHRIKNQIRWFKGSRDRGIKSNIAS